MTFIGKLLFLITVSATLAVSANAQATLPDDEDTQIWGDVQVTIPVHKKIDLLALSQLRIGENMSRVNEIRAGGGVTFKPNNRFSIGQGYIYIETRNLLGMFRTEHRYTTRATYKFPLKKIGLNHRSLFEYRVRNSIKGWRYRPSLTFEVDMPEKLIGKAKLFLTEEPFYVSTTRKFSRNRISLGISKPLSSRLTLELYYLRQNDGYSRPGDLNVLGTSWKINL